MRRVLVSLLLVSGIAVAREPDGALSLIVTPNDGIPVIVLPGESFDAALTEQAALKLVAGDGRSPALDAAWSEQPGGRFQARCTVAADAPPGMYALEAAAGDRTDRNARAVFVRASYPDYYIIAHLTDTHIGATGRARSPEDVLRDIVKWLNDSPAAFALITGDLTHDGQLDQFQQFLAILDTCIVPTFVCPGNHDRGGGRYERVFGPDAYVFRFGKDGYIGFDTKDFLPADELGNQDGDLSVWRRAIKPCRWSVGFTHRYEPFMGMRAQIVLFLDDPLDHLIVGHRHRANNDSEKTVMWGTTPITLTPAAVDGYVRLFDVSVKGVKGREPQRVAAVE